MSSATLVTFDLSLPVDRVDQMTDHHLFVTWRHPDGLIHPVGLLTQRVSDESQEFEFVYLKHAETLDGFPLLPGLPELHRLYVDDQLFPVFRKRQMPRQRPDYAEYVETLGLDVETDPFEVMARNEGRKMTDRIEVFAPPRRTENGNLTALFFARGVRHLEGASDAVAGLRPGDRLSLLDEPKNSTNPQAILINTRNNKTVGWIPDYLLDTVHDLRDLIGEDDIMITAEHVNPPEVEPYMRLICRLTAPWPENYEPLSGPQFQPIVA